MRLAILFETWPAASETFLAREVTALRTLGHTVLPVALRAEAELDPAAWYVDAGALPARGVGAVFRAVARELPYRPALAARWFVDLPVAASIARRLRAERWDLLHAAWSNRPAQLAWMARRLGGPPYTVAAHARDVFAAPAVCHEALLEARGVAVCNRAAEAAMRRRWLDLGERIAYLPHGLPLDQWPRRAAEPDGPPLVLAVGRLVAKKGFDLLVEASGQLVRGGVKHRLAVLGDGPERGKLGALAARIGAPLELPGWQPVGKVADWLRQATVLAAPSRIAPDGDRDGLPNVLLEAAATGVPLITTAAGSAGDLVENGVTGLIVPADDAGELCSALRLLLADGALRRRLADAARSAVEGRFDLARNAARLADWLTTCAALPPRG